jgi:hypothetical protein
MLTEEDYDIQDYFEEVSTKARSLQHFVEGKGVLNHR